MNNDLRNKKKNYLSFIKILYEGIKLTSLKIASNNELIQRFKNKYRRDKKNKRIFK